MNNHSLPHRVAVAALSALILLWAAASLRWPFNWDHGIFGWIGDTIVHGGMPYRDAWDVKGPLTFYTFALVQLVVGKAMWGIRLFDLLMLSATALATARLVRHLGGPGAGLFGALFLALQYGGAGFWDTAQPDGWAAFLMVFAVMPLVTGGGATSLPLAARSAAIVGVCSLFKPLYGAFLVVPLLYVLLADGMPLLGRLRNAAVVGLACGVPIALCALWFAWRGALGSLVDTYVLYNLEQSRLPMTTTAVAARRFLWRLTGSPVLLLGAAAGAVGVGSVLRTDRRSGSILAAWVVLGFWAVWTQHRFWSLYQWHVAYVPLGVVAWIGVGRLWHRPSPEGRPAWWRALALAAGAFLFAGVIRAPARQGVRWLQLVTGRLTAEQYDSAFATDPLTWSVPGSRRVAAFVEEHTEPGDRVFVWSDPTVNYLTGRPSVGRLIFHNAFNTDHPTPHREAYRAELLRSLATHPPKYFIIARRSLELSDSINETNVAGRFPGLAAALAQGYHPVAEIDDLVINLRNRGDSVPPY
jgi:hypothetical protein